MFRFSYPGVFSLTLSLCACSFAPELESDLSDYQSRLANVLEQAPAEQPASPILSYPDKSSLMTNIPDVTIRLTEFYALQSCPVATLIAERNTALGRIQLPSVRYHYEVALIAGLEDCLQRHEDAKTKQQLQQWLEQKQHALPKVWVALVQSSQEMKMTLSSNSGYLTGDAKDNANQVFQALTYLVSLPDNPQATIADTEFHLKTLRDNPLPAKLWRTQTMIAESLTSTTKWLEQQQQDLHCDSPQQEQRMSYLRNVFQLFFIESIQPLAAALNAYQYRLAPIVDTVQNTGIFNASLLEYLNRQTQGFADYQNAMREHVQLWQALFKQCGVQAGDVS